MKSMFLILILTTIFSPLILTSDPDPHGAAAAVAAVVTVTAKNLPVEEIMFCLSCGRKTVDQVDKQICAMCRKEFAREVILAKERMKLEVQLKIAEETAERKKITTEQEDKACLLADEKTMKTHGLTYIATQDKASWLAYQAADEKYVESKTKVYWLADKEVQEKRWLAYKAACKEAEKRAAMRWKEAKETAITGQAVRAVIAEQKIHEAAERIKITAEKRAQEAIEKEKTAPERRVQKAAERWLERNARAVAKIKEEKVKK